jgi:hypothetical protein
MRSARIMVERGAIDHLAVWWTVVQLSRIPIAESLFEK